MRHPSRPVAAKQIQKFRHRGDEGAPPPPASPYETWGGEAPTAFWPHSAAQSSWEQQEDNQGSRPQEENEEEETPAGAALQIYTGAEISEFVVLP